MNYGIGNVKDKSKALFTTTTAPTESGGVITLATTDIVESGYKVGDYLAYVDSSNISALYSISAISSGTATLTLIGAIGSGGKQLYQHNIYFDNAYTRLSGTSYPTRGTITIINDSDTPMTFESIKQFLAQNDFKCAYADLGTNTKWYGNVNIETKVSSSYKQNYGICTNSDVTFWGVTQTWGSTGTINKTTTLDGITYTINITDTIIAL